MRPRTDSTRSSSTVRSVGDQELTPGFTSYSKRLQVQTFEVGDRLHPGDNEFCALVSDGWFRGLVGYTREHDVYGSRLGLLAQLEVDGVPVLVTDGQWESAASGTVADLMEGQQTDLRVHDAALPWMPVRSVEGDFDTLCGSDAPPVRRVELVRPQRITCLADGRRIVDLGRT